LTTGEASESNDFSWTARRAGFATPVRHDHGGVACSVLYHRRRVDACSVRRKRRLSGRAHHTPLGRPESDHRLNHDRRVTLEQHIPTNRTRRSVSDVEEIMLQQFGWS
jgi:hypothetical protein